MNLKYRPKEGSIVSHYCNKCLKCLFYERSRGDTSKTEVWRRWCQRGENNGNMVLERQKNRNAVLVVIVAVQQWNCGGVGIKGGKQWKYGVGKAKE